MEETDDPTKVFEQYADGVVVHEDKTVTISPKVQRDILDCTAGLMHEHKKIYLILTVILTMLHESARNEENPGIVLNKIMAMLNAYFENPDDVHAVVTSDPSEVDDILTRIQLLGDDEGEVQN